MKRIRKMICVLLVVFLVLTSHGCSNSEKQEYDSLEDSFADYLKAVEGEIPENLRLTICCIPPGIATRRPVSVEELMDFPDASIIVVESEELAAHSELLRKLEPSILVPVEEESYIDARMYYFLEAGNDKLLEVIIGTGGVFVNGFAVEFHWILLELVAPFLPEDLREMWMSGVY